MCEHAQGESRVGTGREAARKGLVYVWGRVGLVVKLSGEFVAAGREPRKFDGGSECRVGQPSCTSPVDELQKKMWPQSDPEQTYSESTP